MPLTWLREFLRLEAFSGIILIFAAAAALLFANSPLGDYYVEFLNIHYLSRIHVFIKREQMKQKLFSILDQAPVYGRSAPPFR